MKIDAFCHILPDKYLKTYARMNPAVMDTTEGRNPGCCDINLRLRLMNRYPDVMQVLTIAQPSPESLVGVKESIELSRIANEELAGLVAKYPDKFAAGVACLPVGDMDAALAEAEYAVTKLRLKGVQIFCGFAEGPVHDPRFRELCEMMAGYDLPIWIHPRSDKALNEALFGWPFATATAMWRIVAAGIFTDFPDIKFITHHCGSLVPYFEKRIKWLAAEVARHSGLEITRHPEEHFRKFYNDTAVYGNTPALMLGYSFFGAGHLLFGTDAPLGPGLGLTVETMQSVERMDIPEDDRERIFYGNAVDLLKLPL